MKNCPPAVLWWLASAVILAACGGSEAPAKEKPTQRQRDSVLGASKVIPGAAGVRGALRVSDSADARNRLRDSLASAP